MRVSELIEQLMLLPLDSNVMIETTFHHQQPAPIRMVHSNATTVVICEHWLAVERKTVTGFDGVEYETKGL